MLLDVWHKMWPLFDARRCDGGVPWSDRSSTSVAPSLISTGFAIAALALRDTLPQKADGWSVGAWVAFEGAGVGT